ncbi:MAG: hypothetical protein WD295_00560, partial [Bacteroidota bacterium]
EAVGQVREISDKARKAQDPAIHKSAGLPRYAPLNINNVITWSRSDGQSNHTPNRADGAYYPRGTANVIFQDGLIWGAKAFLDPDHTQPVGFQPIRIGGALYGVGTRAGWVISGGEFAVPVDPDHPRARIFRIRRDYAEMSEDELRRDASEYYERHISDVSNTMMESVRRQYDTDWNEWPVHLGAPYIERNGVPGYQPPPPFGDLFTADSLIAGRYDEPGLAGVNPDNVADQVLWMVYNDLDTITTTYLLGSHPLGLEIQKTVWGYRSLSSFGNMYFTRHRIINKGGVNTGAGIGALFLDSMYVGQFSDPDIGSYRDDLAGCDTLLQMGFAYNGNTSDEVFAGYGLPPPSVGYVVVLGPAVSSPGDSGVVDMKWRNGVRNLPATSFCYFPSGSPYSFPPGGPDAYFVGSGRWWKLLRGYAPIGDFASGDIPYAHGPYPESKFPLSGDPVTRTGFIDGLGTSYSFPPGDTQILLNSGPFSLAPGESREIVMAVVFGLGADNLS